MSRFAAVLLILISIVGGAAFGATTVLDPMDENPERWGPASVETVLVKAGRAALKWQPGDGAIRRDGLSVDLHRNRSLRLWIHSRSATFARIRMSLLDAEGKSVKSLTFKVDWKGWNRMELPPDRFREGGSDAATWARIRGMAFEQTAEGFEPSELVIDGIEVSTEYPQIPINDHEVLIDWLYRSAEGLRLWKPTEETTKRAKGTWGFSKFWCWGTMWLTEDPKKRDTCAYTREFGTDLAGYDTLEVRVTNDTQGFMTVHVKVDGKWSTPVSYVKGTSRFQEIAVPLPKGGRRLDAVTLDIGEPPDRIDGPAGRQLKCNVSWLLLRKTGTLAGVPPTPIQKIAPAPLNGSLENTEFPGGIYFRTKDLPAIRKLFKEGVAKDLWVRLRKQADGYLETKPEAYAGKWYPGGYWVANRADQKTFGLAQSARVCALVYAISGEKKYADHARRVLLTMARIDHWVPGAFARYPLGWGGHGNPFAESEISYNAALAYDWAYTALSDAERREFEEALLRKGVWWTVDKLKHNPGILKMNQGVVFDARIGCALIALERNHPELAPLRKQSAEWLWQGLDAYSLSDGESTEGVGYWHFTWNSAAVYVAALASRDPEGVRARAPEKILKAMDWIVHMKSNNDPGYRCMFFCDGGGGAPSPEVSALYAKYFKSTTGAWFQKRHKAPGAELAAFMWEHDTPAKTPPMIRSRHFRDSGYIILRDGFEYGDTLFTLLGQPNLPGHNQHDRCSFSIEAFGEYLAMDPGMISYSNPAHRSLADTRLHNTVTINGADSGFNSRVTAFFAAPGLDYAAVDGSEAYRLAKRYTRKALYLHPDRFAILDDIELTEPGRIEWNLNSGGALSIDGSRVVARAKTGSLVADFATPSQLQMETEEWPCGYAGEKNHHGTIYKKGDRQSERFLVGLATMRRGDEQQVDTTPIVQGKHTIGFRTATGPRAHVVLTGKSGQTTKSGDIETDAELAVVGTDGKNLTLATMIAGRRLARGAKVLLSASQPGNCSVQYRDGWLAASVQAPAGTEVFLSFPNGIKSKRFLLGDVSGGFKPGEATCDDGACRFRVPQGPAPQGGYWLIVGAPEWLELNEAAPAKLVETFADGKPIGAGGIPEGVAPKTVEMRFSPGSNPIDSAGLEVFLNGERVATDRFEASATDTGGIAVLVQLDKILGPDSREPKSYTTYRLEAALRDKGLHRRRASGICRFSVRPKIDADVVFLSDIKPLKAFAHGGLIRDRAYGNGALALGGAEYPKGLTTHPKRDPKGAHAEIVYDLIPYKGKRNAFRALVGMQDGRPGSVRFFVYTRKGDAPWIERAKTDTMASGTPPVDLSVPLGDADQLRLYATDAGDGINSDHAVWVMARLE